MESVIGAIILVTKVGPIHIDLKLLLLVTNIVNIATKEDIFNLSLYWFWDN